MESCNVIGLGYIGLPTAILIANSNTKVFGIDNNLEIVKNVNASKTHIKESNVEEKLKNVLKKNTLIAKTKPCKADVFLIAVPTPFEKQNSINIPEPNLDFVYEAVESILPVLEEGNLIIIESTCPVGTTQKIKEFILKKSNIERFFLAYCPERVLPGNLLNELISNDRIIGGINNISSEKALNFYLKFCKGNLHKTSSQVAEMTKLSENAFRDVNIAYANELSMICNELNIDHNEVIELANFHPRVNILNPGCGVGGHCIAVDPWFIASAVPNLSLLIQSSRKVNENKKNWSFDQIVKNIKQLETKLQKNPVIGCLGLAYKNDIGDLRESPSEQIVLQLIKEGFDILACEPNLDNHSKIKLYDINTVLRKADIIVIFVPHFEFKKINFIDYRVIDFCGVTLNK